MTDFPAWPHHPSRKQAHHPVSRFRARRRAGLSQRRHVALLLLPVIAVLLVVAGCHGVPRAATLTSGGHDYTRWVNVDQNGSVYMHYPLGRVGLWSDTWGETPDNVTRGLRIYPTVDQVVYRTGADWRSSITASPSQTTLTYSEASPAKGSSVALTITPNVAVFRYHFTNVASYGAVDFTVQELSSFMGGGGIVWSRSSVKHIDSQTSEVVLSDGSPEHTHYFYIRFSTPAIGHGTFTVANVNPGATAITGDDIGGYATFGPRKDVTVAVALSMTSMRRAERNFRAEFPTFDFAGAVVTLKRAWNATLGHVDVLRAPFMATRQIYTGLYSVYANIFDVTDNPTGYVPVAGSRRLLTIGSSPYWEYEGGGYLRSSFDQGRNVYAMLTLVDPGVIADILNTYLAQYKHDGYLYGNWDPFSVHAWADQQWGFFSYYFLRAELQGVRGVDYKAAETAVLNTEGRNATSLYAARCGFYRYGFIPADICSSYYMSRGMELSTHLAGLAHLAYLNGDTATYRTYIRYSTAYLTTWNPAAKVFQGRTAGGAWAPRNAGFFEGDARRYAFDEPHDGIGLARIYGDAAMTSDLASTYAVPGYDYNDYQLSQPYLAIQSNSPATAQRILRNYFLPEFNCLYMAENPPCGGSSYYTDNASALVLANLGLYPLQSPGAAWVLNSPAVTTAVINGATRLTIHTRNNSATNPYVASVQLNGTAFPSHFISGETLVRRRTTLTFGMARRPARIGEMYITGADGEVLSAGTDNRSYLRFSNRPLGGVSRVKLYAARRPRGVSVNGAPLPANDWSYDARERTMSVGGLSSGTVRISFAP